MPSHLKCKELDECKLVTYLTQGSCQIKIRKERRIIDCELQEEQKDKQPKIFYTRQILKHLETRVYTLLVQQLGMKDWCQ